MQMTLTPDVEASLVGVEALVSDLVASVSA
jgi:hypothetical protein